MQPGGGWQMGRTWARALPTDLPAALRRCGTCCCCMACPWLLLPAWPVCSLAAEEPAGRLCAAVLCTPPRAIGSSCKVRGLTLYSSGAAAPLRCADTCQSSKFGLRREKYIAGDAFSGVFRRFRGEAGGVHASASAWACISLLLLLGARPVLLAACRALSVYSGCMPGAHQ